MRKLNQKGFTLVELLIVIAVIAILASVVFVALDPATRFADARNSNRWQSVNSILDGIIKYQVDNDGDLPGADDTDNVINENTSSDTIQILGSENDYDSSASGYIDCSTAAPTCTGSSTAVASSNCYVNLSSDLANYLAQIPEDPDTGTAADTRYYIDKTTAGRIIIGSCDAEDGEEIEVMR